MGINYARSCCGRQQQQKKLGSHKQLQKQTLTIRQDYSYFSQQKWFRFQSSILFDTNVFIFLYPNYHQQQDQLIKYWKKIVDLKRCDSISNKVQDDVLSEKWKYAIRRGVPLIHYKTIISQMFYKNLENLYGCQSKNTYSIIKIQTRAMKDQQPAKNLFGIQGLFDNIGQYSHCDILNVQGKKALNDLLQTIQFKKGQIVYNKYIIHFVPILMIFLNQDEIYQIVSSMIDNSIYMKPQRQASLRWHITITESYMVKLAENFFFSLKEKSYTILKISEHFDQFKIDGIEIYREIAQNFFYGYLSFPNILKILLMFLNEGVKAFHRVIYALLKISYQLISEVKNKTHVLAAVRKRGLNLTAQESSSLFKMAFTLRVNKYSFSKMLDSSVESEDFVQSAKYYLPKIKGQSEILSFTDIETIWDFLPYYLKNFDTARKFPEQSNLKSKYNLPSLISSMKPQDCGFIVIETPQNAVFGIFLASWLKNGGPKQYYGSSQNFIFQLYPKKKKYISSARNIYYCFTPNATECKFGGGGAGSSLQISFDLSTGLSYKSDTYQNDPLHRTVSSSKDQSNNNSNSKSAQFKIKRIQTFQLY